jgi:formate dehydrogenase major subunit
MTNHWVDLKNADAFMICGGNPSENHPVAWKWIEKAREERGAKIIVVDPRFTRSAARADHFSFIRPGTDIAFFGALIKYAIDHNYINWEYVQNYTNAPMLVHPDFKGPWELDGLFSGYNPEKRSYDKSTWTYQTGPDGNPIRVQLIPIQEDPNFPGRGVPVGPKDANGNYIPIEWDLIRQGRYDEMRPTVFAKLAKHFSRYTYEGDDSVVARVCGMDPGVFKEIAEAYVGTTHKREKSGNLIYAMGLTQFTVGSQKIRAFSILQSLLGNMGMPGGGINAARGESNVQGSTDFALLSHLWNGYISVPNSTDHPDLASFLDKITPKTPYSYWSNTPKFVNSFLMAYYGPYAKEKGLEAAYQLLPKVKKGYNYTHIGLFEDMYKGVIKGLISWGQNPPVGGPNANLESAAMDKLEWYVAVDLWDTEAMNFWRRPGVNPRDIQTEVWALPAASSVEKSGSVTNSGRLVQYRWKAVEPPGEARSDAWIMHQLMKALKELYEKEGGPNKEAITELFWAYEEDEHGDPDLDQVWLEINGFVWPEGEFSWEKAFKKPVFGFGNLKDDGSTVCGIWIYSGSWASDDDIKGIAKYLNIGDIPDTIPREGKATSWNGIPFNKAQWHFQKTPIYYLGSDGVTIYKENPPSDARPINVGTYPNWAWAWPVNRRIIYNRCSCDYSGKPFAPDKALFTFKEDGTLDMKNDVQDFFLHKDYEGKVSLLNYSGAHPFIMTKEKGAQVALLFSSGMAEGPFPEHYEPRESPVANLLSKTQNNPATKLAWDSAKNEPDRFGFAEVGDPRFPYVGTTYRVTEHWQAGQMTRNNPWLGEAMPEMFVEISKELADELGIKNGDLVEVESLRGKVQGVAIVTVRLKPLVIGDGKGGKKVCHIVGLPWHFGFTGLFPGGPERDRIPKKSYAANQLTPHVGDANTSIPEYKAFLVNLRKVK